MWVASKALGCDMKAMYRVCRGYRGSTGGYVFRFLDDYLSMSEDEKSKIDLCPYKKGVYCPELDSEFESINDAVKKCDDIGIKVCKSHISECMNGKRKTHGKIDGLKLTWRKINEV